MWVITYRNRPATLDALNEAEPPNLRQWRRGGNRTYIAAPSESACRRAYLQEFGWSWRERPKGVECKRCVVTD